MIKKIVVFLVRKKLGVKKLEHFQFENQISKTTVYFIGDDDVIYKLYKNGRFVSSNISLNWLLDNRCKVVEFEDDKQDS